MALGRWHVEEGHAAARDAADRQNGMQHSQRVVICSVAGLSFDLQDAVATRQRLPDVGAVPEVGR